MKEIFQKIINSTRPWRAHIATAFKAGKYIQCFLIAVAPIAGLWAGAKLFWLIADLIYRFLQRHGEYILGFFGVPVLFVFAFWRLFIRKADNKPSADADADTAKIMKFAKQGLNALLDHIFLVCESLAEQTEIYSPKTKNELAYPDKTRCFHIEDGVAVLTVRLYYAGEIDTTQFLERFNKRMRQKLNNGELLDKPPAVFTDKDNTPHTAIQAIRCISVKGQRYIRLEVIRVNQAAVALLDKVDRERAPEAGGEGELYDDDL